MAGRYRFKKKRYYRRRPRTVAAKAQKALSVAKYAKRLAYSERFYHDYSTPSQLVSWATAPVLVSDIAQGDDDGQRTGNQVRIRSLLFNFYARGNAQNTSNAIRAIVFIDKQNTGTTPTTSDILQFSGNIGAVISPLNVDHTTRYKIIYDRRFTFSHQTNYTAATSATSGVGAVIKSWYKKMFMPVRWTGPSATDTYTNNIYVLFVSDVGANDPDVTWGVRLGYDDH